MTAQANAFWRVLIAVTVIWTCQEAEYEENWGAGFFPERNSSLSVQYQWLTML